VDEEDVAVTRYPSLKEVATRAGVSFQTASKVLNGGPVRVAPATAERIEAAARELGYSPNSLARSLLRQKTMTIGLVAGSLSDPALAEFVVGAERRARSYGHSVLVGNLADDDDDGPALVRSLVERRVDGIIAASPQLEEDSEVAELLRRYGPAVSLHHVPGGGVPLVGSNHREVGRLAAEHLLSGGRRVLGTVSGPYRRRVVRSRLHGFEEAQREAGLEVAEDLVIEADWTPADAARAVRLLLERVPALDALFVHSDVMAVGVLDALASLGRAVPDDVAVVSCDDLPFAAFLAPPLTTVRIPFHDTGAACVELLLRLAGGKEVALEPLLLPVDLVVRDSSGPGWRAERPSGAAVGRTARGASRGRTVARGAPTDSRQAGSGPVGSEPLDRARGASRPPTGPETRGSGT
jgi:LacI family transcriptional regulator